MFRKEYKKANDNIKVDEALLEKTLEAAFAEKPGKKTYYYRSFAPIAAALVIVIGASSAYPKLIKEPELEQTSVSTVSPTMNPEAELKFEAVEEPESTPRPEPVHETQTNKAPQKTRKAEKSETVEAVPQPVELQESEPAVVSMDEEQINAPAMARAMPYMETEQKSEGFSQVSCKFLDGIAEYVFEDETGQSFTVSVTDICDSQPAGLSVERNGKLYILSSPNMSDAEMLEAFETLNI